MTENIQPIPEVPPEIHFNLYLKLVDLEEDDENEVKIKAYKEARETVQLFEKGEGSQEVANRIKTELIEREPILEELFNRYYGKKENKTTPFSL